MAESDYSHIGSAKLCLLHHVHGADPEYDCKIDWCYFPKNAEAFYNFEDPAFQDLPPESQAFFRSRNEAFVQAYKERQKGPDQKASA